jgi:CRISPR-associated endonuclease/helicase Cas3
MTATRPLIFEESDRTELVGEQEELFGGLSRVVLSNRSRQETELDDFLLEVEDQIGAEPDRSVGIVCNTVACARRVYQHLNESCDRPCTYLSSQIVPCDRRERISRLRQGDAAGLLVSTQVIEAGVDISLDVIHRDFAPLDSIIQTAGRCNRNAEAEGEVVMWKLLDSERYRRPFCKMIYDALLLDSTERVLDERDTIPEAQFRELGDAYFEDLKRRGADAELHYDFAMMNFGLVAEEFQLIEELPGRQSYFVMLDDEAEHLWETYCSLQDMPPLERRRRFMEIKRPFYERIINVARPEGEATGEVEPLYLDSDMGVYYDTAVGFQEAESDATAFF